MEGVEGGEYQTSLSVKLQVQVSEFGSTESAQMILFFNHLFYSYKNDNCIIYPTRTVPVIKELVKLECDALHQSDHQGQRGSEGPGPEGEREQAGEEHGAAPAHGLAPAPAGVGDTRLCQALANQSTEGVSQEHGVDDFCKKTFQNENTKT